MLEALVLFTPGGLILYQYSANPSLLPATSDDNNNINHSDSTDKTETFTRTLLNNDLIAKILLDPAVNSTKTYHIAQGVTLSWKKHTPPSTRGGTANTNNKEQQQQPPSYVCVAVYPDILFEGPRQYLKLWAEALLQETVREYNLFWTAKTILSNNNDTNNSPPSALALLRPDPTLFHSTFVVLLEQSKSQKPTTKPTTTASSSTTTGTTVSNNNTKNAPEKMRRWHDGNATVTAQAMAALDMSKSPNSQTAADENDDKKIAHKRALQEARAAYLPTKEEAEELSSKTKAPDDNDPQQQQQQSSWLTGLFQQLTGTKILTAADLVQPIARMEELLAQKNISQDLARDIGRAVADQLIGKRLHSLYTVQTAVQQAVQTTVTQLLQRTGSLDLLRAVRQKRGDGSLLSSLTTKMTSNRRPYVITVMGINGIGKTTTLAKLAYYFIQNNCSPLLVAGDTFRSGAVEQLQVHADCLGIPLFQQGYSKNPSTVATAAIAYAMQPEQQRQQKPFDVVLIDTAGRMQNNVPLMKALGKLVTDNKPDCCLMVCEALVGHDGVSQFQMFRQAAGRVDGLILTKFDTVDTKMGACLTLTHECGAPIVFLGVGQKYHHLQPMNLPLVIQSLFS